MKKPQLPSRVAELRQRKINELIASLRENNEMIHQDSTSHTVEPPTSSNASLSVSQADLIDKLTESTEALGELGVVVSNQQYPFGFA